MTQLTTENTLATLRELLHEAGFDDGKPDLRVFWDVFKRFAAMPVAGMDPAQDADMLLFQSALDLAEPDKYHPGPHFMVDFTRQFSFEDERGEYAGMEQLNCSFYWDPRPDFEAVTRAQAWSDHHRSGDQFWGSPADGAREWIARVEAAPSFRAALEHEPRAAEIDQGPV